jgi:hypothetical protein
MPVAGIRMAMASRLSLTATRWITNQSSSRLADFRMANHSPAEAGAASRVLDFRRVSATRGTTGGRR